MTIDDTREYARQALAHIDVRYATPHLPRFQQLQPARARVFFTLGADVSPCER
jgi:hypothetical protein